MFFNLLEEPWLPVMPRDGTQIEEVSLADLLCHARSYRCLAGSTPTMTAALYRVVLALIHRAYGPGSLSRWGELWRAENGFPGRELAAYADEYGDRFDLFDARRPFFQCPALAAKKASSTAKLVAYRAAGIGRTLFDHTTAAESPALPPAEAARWLITAQMYDTGGLKTQYTKDQGLESRAREPLCLRRGRRPDPARDAAAEHGGVRPGRGTAVDDNRARPPGLGGRRASGSRA